MAGRYQWHERFTGRRGPAMKTSEILAALVKCAGHKSRYKLIFIPELMKALFKAYFCTRTDILKCGIMKKP